MVVLLDNLVVLVEEVQEVLVVLELQEQLTQVEVAEDLTLALLVRMAVQA